MTFREVRGEAVIWPPVSLYIQKDARTGYHPISLDKDEILLIPKDNPERPLAALDAVWRALQSYDELAALRDEVWQNLVSARSETIRELDCLILRRVIPGRCRLCPA